MAAVKPGTGLGWEEGKARVAVVRKRGARRSEASPWAGWRVRGVFSQE